ncbi:unnamed protein product, partial [Closterium sp. NIES-53]
MASLRVLAFDHEGRPLQFDTWLDDLQLYLQSDSRDNVSLFDHTSGAAPAPLDTADSTTHSQWLTRDAVAHIAIRNHLPLAECAHFGQHRTAQTLYDAVVARYSSPATAALGFLLLPCLFPELSTFATVEDLVFHLRTSDARYRAAAPAEFLDRNRPPMFITLYLIVTRLPDSLRSVRDHFLSLDPISLRPSGAAMDAEMASLKSTDTYGEAAAGFLPAFKARYVARGFSQRQEVDLFQTFSPTPKMTTLRVLLHVAAQRDYELHSKDFSTAFLQSSLHEEIWLRCPPGFTGSFPAGTQWSLRRPVYGLRQGPREWHDTLRTTLAALGFAPSTADPSLFLRTDTLLPPFYVLVYVDDLVFATVDTEALTLVKSELQKRHTCTDLGELRSYLGLQITRDRARRTITLTQSHMVHQVLQHFSFQFSSPHPTSQCTSQSLSAPTSDESLEPSGLYLELVGCLMYLMTCTRPDLAYPLSLLACYVAPGLHLSLGSGSVSWRSTHSSSVLSSSCEAEIYVGAMAAHELRWLTYLLIDLGEQPRSPP